MHSIRERYSMKYEIVELKEKKITGLAARTSNDDPKMGEIIGNLWTRLFQDNLYDKIQDKVSPYTYCLYSDYDEKGYQATVGCDVSKSQEGLAQKTAPAGKYARFEIHGNMVTAVQNAWNEIWQMPLDRTYTGDFEEYVDSNMTGDATIFIYIAIR